MIIALQSTCPTLSGVSLLFQSALDSFGALTVRPFLLASVVGDLVDKLREVLNMIMLFGFLYGTIRIMGGAAQIRRGEIEEGKAAIISGALIAGAPLIMRILFEIFFGGQGL